MKTPIEFPDIRVGDTVERECEGITSRMTVDHFTLGGAICTSGGGVYESVGGDWFLLDRPTLPVELPSTPTLGWADDLLGFWNEWRGRLNGRYANGSVSDAPKPTAFTRATAVPTEALVSLRAIFADCIGKTEDEWPHIPRALDAFFRAVDAAGSAE